MEQNNVSFQNVKTGEPLSQKEIDEMFMRRCLQLAKNGRENAKPNPMVGAVIVSGDGRIIGEGYHVRCGEGHAEVNAFASVKPEDEHLLSQATIYVSLEPCSHYGKTPPCADLIVRKGVKRCVCGCVDPFAKVQGRGIRKIREAGIEVTVGVLEAECLELNKRFITFNTHQRPYIILKWAQTANGFLDNGGRGMAISSPFTKMLSHKLRDGVLALPVMIGCCGFKNLAHVFLSFLPVLVGLAFAKLFPSYGILDDGQMGELLDTFGDEKTLVIAAFFFSFSGERDGDDGVYSVEELNA